MHDSAKQIARFTALGALFLIPLAPLIVANNFFFPFITGKAFYFRTVVEIAVAAWGALALLDRAYRPRFGAAGAAVLLFVAWMAIADSFALNAHKAFWSNFERMEGWILLVHLAGFFFAASNVLRVEKRWRAWFLASLSVGVVVSLYALLQLIDPKDFPIHQGSTRIDATLGNSAYLAIYLLFNAFIAGWLAMTERRPWLKGSLFALAALEAVLVFFTGTRGAIVGLAGGLALAAVLTALTAGKRARMFAAGGLALIILVAGSLYLARDSAFVAKDDSLNRIAHISLADLKVRFMLWNMAWQGFTERPIAGWGQEGFNYIFNAHYDPRLYGQEPWFDRAHNAFIDWLVAGGAPGFLLYLSLFAVALWLLWRRSELSRAERIALTAALAGYAAHNLVIFDNLYAYVYFFAILALLDAQTARHVRVLERAPEIPPADGMAYALPSAAVLAFAAVLVANVPGIAVAGKLIEALQSFPQGPSGNIAAFTELLARPAFAGQEVREQLVVLASLLARDQNTSDEIKRQASALAVSGMQTQVARYPLDTRGYFELAYAYSAAGDTRGAATAIAKALELTPTKEDLWTMAGAIAWSAGDPEAAKGAFNEAYKLAPGNRDLAAYAAAGYAAAGDAAAADEILMAAYGTTSVDAQILADAYYRTRDWPRLVRVWEVRAAQPDASVETLFNLAAAQYAAGKSAAAIATIQEAVKRYPEAAASGEAAIKQIRAGIPVQ